MAGAIAELAKNALARDFRNIDPRLARVVLAEAGPRVLPVFPEKLSAVAARALERLGVEVRTGQPVSQCDANGVVVGGERIETRTVIWAAGVAASAAGKWFSAVTDRAGRVKVGGDLSLPGHEEIFVVGDTAAAINVDGKLVPGIAPAAKQAGIYVARRIAAAVSGRHMPEPFRYRHFGNLATIGRAAAVADFGFVQLSGRIAWLLWGVAHIFFLIGFRNRVTVALDWMVSYVTYQRGARLITTSMN